MEQLRPLGRRDIFGILLPGAILVFIGAYVLFGVLVLLDSPVQDLLRHEFLLTAVLLVAAYLVGSLLRLFAADDVDKKSSKYLLKEWYKEHQARNKHGFMSNFEKYKAQLMKGGDVSDVPDGFDEWLWRTDEFPYPAWQNRMWRSHGFHEALNFFQDNYKTSMWSENRASPKSFFNYCKLVIIGGGGPLADEVNMAEGLTRFFAGTVAALRLSTWVLGVALIAQLFLVAAPMFAPRWGIGLAFPADAEEWTFQGFYFVFTIALILASQWVCRLIVKRFRHLRLKETETVYHAFYLHSVHHPNEAAKRDRPAQGKTLGAFLKNLFAD